MRGSWGALAGAAALLLPMAAQAHLLSCEKTVDGKTYEEISTYPATLHYRLVTKNVHPTSPSDVLGESDPLLEGEPGFAYSKKTPYTLPLGAQNETDYDLVVSSFDDCKKLAYGDQMSVAADYGQGVVLQNTFSVTWDSGSATCSASVLCKPPVQPPPSPNATRTIGFYKTHISALDQCLAGGAIDLGIATVDTRSEALGILWGATSRFPDGSRRTGLDQDRFIAARQLLGAICNERLFGAEPTPSSLFDDALAAIEGTQCSDITSVAAQLDAFNNSNDSVDFPAGFSAGPATPQDAKSQAADPTTPSGQTCSP